MTFPQSLRITCPRCGKHLSAAEYVEQFCDDCGDVRKVKPGDRKAA
jgi:predicted RNA-binding Zn-ribbon protein involved in translation (DUF1610 family)